VLTGESKAGPFASVPVGSWIVFKRWQNLIIEQKHAPTRASCLWQWLCWGVASLSRAAVVSDPEPPFGAETVRALTAIAETGRMACVTPGMILGLWVPGKGNYVRSFGIGNLATGAPVAIKDHFRIASITKTFTATAVLQLIGQERLALDVSYCRER
jgi:CubicO group peptidase (beta-lactamase class C family)